MNSSEQQGNASSSRPSASADGKVVAFESEANDLVPFDANNAADIFVRDRAAGTITRVSVGSRGLQANDDSFGAAVSADGSVVAFASFATNLAAGDSNSTADVFLRDRAAGTTTRVSLDSREQQANAFSADPSLSRDGNIIAFVSGASNLVPGDTNK